MLEIRCPKCETLLRLEDDWTGKKGKCPRCGSVLAIPASNDSASAKHASADTGSLSPDAVAPSPPPIPETAAGRSAATPPGTSSPPTPSPPTPGEPAPRLQNDAWRRWLILGSAAAGAAGIVVMILLTVMVLPSGDRQRETRLPNAPSVDRPETGSKDKASDTLTEDLPSRVKRPSTTAQVPPGGGASSNARHGSEAPRESGAEFSGVERQFDDLQCRLIQLRHGIRIPSASEMLEVDGEQLPIRNVSRLAQSPSPILLLPRGVHAVRFRTGELPVSKTVEEEFTSRYEAMCRYFEVDGTIRVDELIGRGARALDVHGAPFLLNFLGAAYMAKGDWEAAERGFRRSLSVNPTFSPAHLNLAECLLRREAAEEAVREAMAADYFNVGNVYGLAEPIGQLRRRLKIPAGQRDPIDAGELVYVSKEPLEEEDLRLAGLMQGLSKYAVRGEERAKILNNLAVHFAQSGRPELGLHHFRRALSVVKNAGPERFELARRIFSTMSDVCRKANFAEAEDYERMRRMVSP